jgi:hypothetical protein
MFVGRVIRLFALECAEKSVPSSVFSARINVNAYSLLISNPFHHPIFVISRSNFEEKRINKNKSMWDDEEDALF